MAHNSLSGLPFPIMAGFFSFLKKPYSDDMYIDKVHSPESSKLLCQNDGRTGVARYIEKQQVTLEELACAEESRPSMTGVAKYLQDQEKHPMTRVAKYALKIKLEERQVKLKCTQTIETSVAKYLQNQPALPKITGVSRYLRHQENLPKVSKVSKYIINKSFEEKLLSPSITPFKETGVSNYLKKQEDFPQKSTVSKYIAKQAILTRHAKIKTPEIIITGVEKYLQFQETLPKTSSVTKYIKRHSQELKPSKMTVAETGVEKYIRSNI